jgi:hypothetical protein
MTHDLQLRHQLSRALGEQTSCGGRAWKCWVYSTRMIERAQMCDGLIWHQSLEREPTDAHIETSKVK